MITFEEIKTNKEINTYIEQADTSLLALGYTEHSYAHVMKVVTQTAYLLTQLGYSKEDINLAKIAAYMHDIGNAINRVDHSQSGALMAFQILKELQMEPKDIALIISAIGNHDEGTGYAVNAIAAALILADKSDVRRSRVRNQDIKTFDIHDRVNYSVTKSNLVVEGKEVILNLEIDTSISPVIEYFEIFMDRMILCRNAAKKLNLTFRLRINGQLLI